MELIRYSETVKIEDSDHVIHVKVDGYPLIKDIDLDFYYYVKVKDKKLVFCRMSDGKLDTSVDISQFDAHWWVLKTSILCKKD